MNEASLTTEFSHWMKAKWTGGSTAIEFKIVKAPKKSLAFSSFQPQQMPSLVLAKHSKLWHKISDESTSTKPFDSFFLVNSEAYVGIFWVKPRAYKFCTLIDIDDFVKYQEGCGKKSIPMEDAKRLASFVVDF